MKAYERRNFLKKIIKAFFSFLLLALLSVIIYIYPPNNKKRKSIDIYLIDEEELPKKGVKKVFIEYKSEGKLVSSKVYLAVNKFGLTAFSPVCTHFGCLVNWDYNKKFFLCPCHAGKYDIDGNVISGPPPKPLKRLPLKIIDGKVYVEIVV
jgi:cytochrome b6-f complex iron-sulfur subunit